MNKKTMKIITIVAIVLSILLASTSVFALTPSELTGTEPTQAGSIKTVGNTIIGIIQTVGIVISVVTLIILGVKYMLGSAQDKSEYKKSMIPYLVGAILIFAASALANVVYEFAISIK